MRLQFIILIIMAVLYQQKAMALQPTEQGITTGIYTGLNRWERADHNKVGFSVTPQIGYRFNSKWEAGAMFKFDHYSDLVNYYGIGAYGRYNCVLTPNGAFRLFVDGQAYYSIGDYEKYYGGDLTDNSVNPVEIGLTPGIAYRIHGSKVDLKLRYLFIGFNNNDRWYKEMGGCVGRGDWILDAGLRRLELGVAVNF